MWLWFISLAWLLQCFYPSVKSLIGPKLHRWGSGREEHSSASVKAARLPSAGFRILGRGTAQKRGCWCSLSNSSTVRKLKWCKRATMSCRGTRFAHSDLVLQWSCPFCTEGFCRAHERGSSSHSETGPGTGSSLTGSETPSCVVWHAPLSPWREWDFVHFHSEHTKQVARWNMAQSASEKAYCRSEDCKRHTSLFI